MMYLTMIQRFNKATQAAYQKGGLMTEAGEKAVNG
jgi:hypothetical protein